MTTRGQDLYMVEVPGQTFTGSLMQVDLTGTFAHHARFVDADLTGCVAWTLRADCASFVRCVLHKGIFRAAALRGVVFRDCDLRGADFSGASLSSAAFVDCDLSDTMWDGAQADGLMLIACDLSKARFTRAELERATLSDCTMAYTSFWLAGLLDTKVTQCRGTALHLRSPLQVLEEVAGGRIIGYRWQTEGGSWHGSVYEVGREYEVDHFSRIRTAGCAAGLHVATLDWAVDVALEEAGAQFEIIQVSMDPKDVLVPYTRGRWRTLRLRVERSLKDTEWQAMLDVGD